MDELFYNLFLSWERINMDLSVTMEKKSEFYFFIVFFLFFTIVSSPTVLQTVWTCSILLAHSYDLITYKSKARGNVRMIQLSTYVYI